MNVVDAGVTALEREQRRDRGEVNWEQVRQAGRAMRELAALPGPRDSRPPAPGERVDGQRLGSTTRGGLAAGIIAADRARPVTPMPDEAADEAHAEPVVAERDSVAALLERMTAEVGALNDQHEQDR